MSSHLPIGLLDSGVGGLTVMKEVAKLLPFEDLIYLADTANLPYGEKSPDAIKKYTLGNSKLLFEKKIKLLIIACHTASSHALKIVRQSSPVPVIGVIDAAIEELERNCKNTRQRIAILGTTSTIQSKIYQTEIQDRWRQALLFPIACPLFVPLIEEALFDHQAIMNIADHYLGPLKEKKMNAALLACTHYPLIKKTIQTILGPEVILIDPAKTVAHQVYEHLKAHSLLNNQTTTPSYNFYATNPSEKFSRLADLFFNIEKNKNS